MEKIFSTVAIIGLGLIGGSLAKAIKQRGMADRIIGYGRSAERLARAQGLGLIDRYSVTLEQGLGEADLIVIGTPVRIICQQLLEITPFLRHGAVVTDVGSVKSPIVKTAESAMPATAHFVGGHPIAGTENSGFESALDDLFENRICVLTPTGQTDREACSRLERFWNMIGSRVVHMDVKTHDIIFGAVSHLPHMVAFALVNAVVALQGAYPNSNILQYSAGGFKDFTRIAASDPVMWRDIAIMNKENILHALDYFEDALAALRKAVSTEDERTIEMLLQKSRDTRRAI